MPFFFLQHCHILPSGLFNVVFYVSSISVDANVTRRYSRITCLFNAFIAVSMYIPNLSSSSVYCRVRKCKTTAKKEQYAKAFLNYVVPVYCQARRFK